MQYFKLVSSYGCKLQREIGLSTGSLLVILFFVSVGVYFIGGIIVLKALRGATGWEMVPNHEFWCKLPSLVKVSDRDTSNKMIITVLDQKYYRSFCRMASSLLSIVVERTVTREYNTFLLNWSDFIFIKRPNFIAI